MADAKSVCRQVVCAALNEFIKAKAPDAELAKEEASN